eukprot:Unigene2735_Nuclearia_a/m.8473 Unigene2735_Nuclearia_a/g.8473  ORF Unigene2735_Nuclearia_a/g.8473 Unigene2735_Nuclearia_a/m.8473 type:complete len:266 (-) Unigene2735_Nuclearia_a:127-924(-)
MMVYLVSTLDLADETIFVAAREGDLAAVRCASARAAVTSSSRIRRHLVEHAHAPINAQDAFNGTPLYYACLCGHQGVVEYLLEMGARCDENTFEGVRCFYGALTNGIKRLLKEHKAVGASLDAFSQFLRRLYGERTRFADVTFVLERQRHVRAHRFVLAARSLFFAEMLSSRWAGRDVVPLPRITAAAFEALLRYLYCARLEVPGAHVAETLLLLRQCRMDDVRAQLEAEIEARPDSGMHVLDHSVALADEIRAQFAALLQQPDP